MIGTESEFEETSLERLQKLGYAYAFGEDLTREKRNVVLLDRLRAFLEPRYPAEAVEFALQTFSHPDGVNIERRNMAFLRAATRGIEAPYRDDQGQQRFAHVHPIDWETAGNNDFLAVNQFTIEGNNTRRPDILILVNGLPVVVFELKSPYDEYKDAEGGYNQLRHYWHDIPQLFDFAAFCVVSDLTKTLHGMPQAGFEHWAEWKSINGEDIVSSGVSTMKTLIEGLFPKDRLLEYIRRFVLFEGVNEKVFKKGAKYHQYFVVRAAVESAVRAFGPGADPRIGVVWHTQGAGKSMEMVFFVAILRQLLNNPAFVIQVDRNALDEQLYSAFVAAEELVGTVRRAESIEDLRSLLRGESGEVIFTTLQKFSTTDGEVEHPVLTDRPDLIVIADEAHRTQYGLIRGLARNLRVALPSAKFIGFTGTPIDYTDADTRAVFGDYIRPIYDMPQSEEDRSTVPIFYEARLATLHLTNPALDKELEEITQDYESEEVERRKPQWAEIARLAGAKDRVEAIAADILAHFEKRQETQTGKAMIVCMSRANCVAIFNAITALRPELRNRELNKGAIKVVMTHRPEVDPEEWNLAGHITGTPQRSLLADRFKDPDDPLRIVIVCDMWLTGFDVPILNTMYIDKPMKGHNLMQAIARVNRVFRDKPGGVIVDYIGVAEYLKEATAKYTASGGRGKPAPPIEVEALEQFLKRLDDVRGLVPEDCTAVAMLGRIEREDLICRVVDILCQSDPDRDAFLSAELVLSAAASLVMHLRKASQNAAEVAFYQAIRANVRKTMPRPPSPATLDKAVRDLMDRSIHTDGVVDLFAKAGIERPDVSIIDDRFVQEHANKEFPNLRLKLLEKLMKDDLRSLERKNPIRARSLLELLESSLEKYHNNVLSAAQLVEEMIRMRKEMDAGDEARKALGLSEEELAFYDALVLTSGQLYDQPFLAGLVRDVVNKVKANLKPDWTKAHREDIRASIRAAVRRVLLDHGVKQADFELIVARVMENAEAVYAQWPQMPVA